METLYLLFDVSWLRESIIERSYNVYIIFPGQQLLLTHFHTTVVSFKHECLFPQWQQLIVRREVVWGEASVCGYQHIGIFFQNVYKLSFQIRLYFLSSFRKILSNPRTMELCLMERLKLCCNFKKMPESPLSESSVQYLSLFSILTDLALEDGYTASGDIMWEEVRDTK